MRHRDKPRLLLLTSSFPRSPSDETCGYIRDFARSLSAQFAVTVLAPRDRGAVEWPCDSFTPVRSSSLLPLGFDPFQASADLNQLISKSWLTKLGASISLVSFFTHAFFLALRTDAICSHWMVPGGLVGALISRMFGKPHIVVEHSGALHLLARVRGGASIARLVVAGSDRVVTVSHDLKNKLIRLCPEAAGKIEVIPMGITADDMAISDQPDTFGVAAGSLTASHRTILFIGRLTQIKGLDLLLEAMDGLGDLELIVAGDGEKRDELERMSRRLSVRARFIGQISPAERRALFSTCDAVVIPSRVLADGRTEGAPVVCLEALAAGCVVVAARVGGLAEIIVDGQNGLLFDADDHLMLRDKLMLALGDDGLRQTMSENARRSAATYDWSRTGLRFGEIIRSSLSPNDPASARSQIRGLSLNPATTRGSRPNRARSSER